MSVTSRNGRDATAATAVDPEAASPFVPFAATARYTAPKATIDPDQSKSWLKRAMPIVMAHKVVFWTALVASFVGLVFQLLIPLLLGDAINNSIEHHTVPLSTYVWLVLGLAVAGGGTPGEE